MTSNHNTKPSQNGSNLSGLYYCYHGTGNFAMEKGFSNMTQTTNNGDLLKYDVTNAIQINLVVRAFNELLGIYKDSHGSILSTTYNSSTNNFPVQNINISSTQFRTFLTSYL